MPIKREMHLGVFLLGTGNHTAGWRHDGAFASNSDFDRLVEIAQIAERGKFDLYFVSDSLIADPGDHPSFVNRLEPTTLIAALSATTKFIGLGATVSSSFSDPFTVARMFASIDHISKGRAAWNVVTTTNPKAAEHFTGRALLAHDDRYALAGEFVDVVRGLWDCWDDGAIVADRATGQFIDPSRMHPLDHQGTYFSVRGPLNMERSPQGRPIVIQAGGSPAGQDLSARCADLVFSVVQDPDEAKRAYDSLKGRLTAYGREPDDLPILPGVMPIIGATDGEAKATLDRLQGWLDPSNAMTLVSNRIGHDLRGHPLDGPIPDFPLTSRNQSMSTVLLNRARNAGMTLRDLYNLTAAGRGHWVIYGSPKTIADTLEDWFTARRADGFIIMPAFFPGQFTAFVDHVVPELQRRGLFRTDYSGVTLRDHLGLSRPAPVRP